VAYSADWRGPEVYETESSLTFEVGTDVVYPYGTSREDRVYTKENSYYITLQYNKKPADAALAEYESDQPWMVQYLSLLSLSDGDSVSSPRSVVTRVRSVGVGPFSGAEFISTLPESAQTERFYVREVILINDNYDAIRVAGSPNNVIVQDARNWQADYEAVDRDNLATFRRFVDSISVGSSEENVSGIQPLDGSHKRWRQ